MVDRRIPLIAPAFVAVLLAPCGDSPTGFRLASAYRLATVNELPVPAAIDSSTMGSHRLYSCIVGRSLEILSGDSAQYAWASDTVEMQDGTRQVLGSECRAGRVAYRRSAERMILSAEAISLPPSLGVPFQPAVSDTL